MSSYKMQQECPHCGDVMDESLSNWETVTEWVDCEACNKPYTVSPQYKFLGFEIKKGCGICGDDDECDCEEATP